MLEGLTKGDLARLQLIPDDEGTASCLAERGRSLPDLTIANGPCRIAATSAPDGVYALMIDAPPSYLRQPRGYRFVVEEGRIVHHRDLSILLRFELIGPADQEYPPCRSTRYTTETLTVESEEGLRTMAKALCMAEPVVSLSAAPKQPERMTPKETGSRGVGYHYVGPETFQDNRGVWGRNYVVDPRQIQHGALVPHRFVAERVYTNNPDGDRWMEAGWAETWDEGDEQFVYEYDSATQEWRIFDEYPLSKGDAVETAVHYVPDVGEWRADYHLWGNVWAVLAQEPLDFDTADRAYNRGEVYTNDGVHPILPPSGFDTGLLYVDGVWRLWDTRYLTDIDEDSPYQCDMIEKYWRFSIHSPVVFIPFVTKG